MPKSSRPALSWGFALIAGPFLFGSCMILEVKKPCYALTTDTVTVADNGQWHAQPLTSIPGIPDFPGSALGAVLVDDQTGYALGPEDTWDNQQEDDGLDNSFHKTTDGGLTWKVQQANLYALDFPTAQTGYAVGLLGTILKTVDGGVSWTSQSSGTARRLRAVAFHDASNGIIVGDSGTVLRTTNGGASWTAVAAGTTQELWDVKFVSTNSAIIVGGKGTILSTSNGGASWSLVRSPTKYWLYSVTFLDADRGWIVGGASNQAGDSLTTLRTTDGGKTWTAAAGKLDAAFSADPIYPGAGGLHFTSALNGWAQYATFGGTRVMKTVDGGETWQPGPRIGGSPDRGTRASRLSFSDATHGWLTSGDSLLTTQDGGATWTRSSLGAPRSIFAIQFTSALTGIGVGLGGTILRTTNGGVTWSLQRGGFPYQASGLSFSDANTGWVYGLGGKIAKTTDGGITWRSQASGTTQTLLGAHFLNAQTGFIVGAAGTLLKTANGGTNWTAQLSGTSVNLNAVQFATATWGSIAGDDGVLLHTFNGGTNWTAQASGTGRNLTGVHFTDGQTGWAVGGGTGHKPAPTEPSSGSNRYWTGGIILRTLDAGAHWTVQDSTFKLKFFGIRMTSATQGIAVGGGPSFRSTYTGPVSGSGADYNGYCHDIYIGYYSQIVTTDNGGGTWTAARTVFQKHLEAHDDMGEGNPLRTISCSANGTCIAAGGDGIVRK